MGYDSRKEDVTIQLVTDAVQSRRSLSTAATAVQVCEVMYSITTPTFIFNDTNHATAMFIQALNESIATGAFDLYYMPIVVAPGSRLAPSMSFSALHHPRPHPRPLQLQLLQSEIM